MRVSVFLCAMCTVYVYLCTRVCAVCIVGGLHRYCSKFTDHTQATLTLTLTLSYHYARLAQGYSGRADGCGEAHRV